MSTSPNSFFRNLSITFLGFLILLGCKKEEISIEDFNPEILVSWNEKLIKIAIEEDGLLTLKGLRTTSMLHVAMHDALNVISPKYESYSYHTATSYKNPIASVAYAAYTIALNSYPNKKEAFDEELNQWLSPIQDAKIKLQAKELGEAAALSILEKRKGDGWNGEAEYTWHPMAPGVYAEFNKHSGTPEGFIFGSGWAKAKPFLLPKQDFFRSPPPPEINSAAYTTAFNEVKKNGASNSIERTNDQTHLAMWWKDFVENSHNRLLRELVIKENLNLWEAARAFALLNMATYDAYINVFDNKFHYNHWRPYTAIRWASNDENPDTEADLEWNNLHQHTYAFPSYPSAHGTASSAAMTTLANTLETGNDYKFVMTTEEVDSAGPFSDKVAMSPPTRSFNSFSDAGFEASISRIYLGIHFRYDSEEGHKLGNKIGEYAVNNYLQPIE
ncbi:vanadium-dependent haloperoxidase [Croceitalea rosinachiae]|uniref:Vanadium-dependent haloperoxidase n=1 Tax=Croceitalea rosinachiae TaxID=3075596 RepID=A0ABU3AAN1_9FLAO|nr:vanadium-dependent haloperoxidase [Croceitalea sp. F388]MDT0606875.1 vanadium-dependent haloperoxidase [Croceitalea sp. F388]